MLGCFPEVLFDDGKLSRKMKKEARALGRDVFAIWPGDGWRSGCSEKEPCIVFSRYENVGSESRKAA